MAKDILLFLIFFYVLQLGYSFQKNRYQTSKFENLIQSKTKIHALGLHGQNFKYLSIIKGKQSVHFPRTVPIAGVYPELTPEDILAPAQAPLIVPGQFAYDFSDPSGPQLGTVAVPGSDTITFADDPIAIITRNENIGIKLNGDGAEVVLIVDRDDKKFNSDMFYAFRNPNNEVEIGSLDKLLPGYTIMGRVILTMVPMVKGDKKQATGFLEDEDEDEE
jgi:hypothetical protein